MENQSEEWFRAVNFSNMGKIDRMIKNGMDRNKKNEEDNTALMIAAEKNDMEVAELLIKGKSCNDILNFLLEWRRSGRALSDRFLSKWIEHTSVDVNAKNKCGETALIKAVQRANERMVRLLLDRGADVNARDKYNKTVLVWAMENYDYSDCKKNRKYNLYSYYFKYSDRRLYERKNIIMNLIAAGANFGKGNYNLSRVALWRAVSYESVDMIILMIKAGARVNGKNGEGKTALMIAVDKEYEVIVQLLIDENANINAKDKQGKTALMIAAERGNEKIVRLLLDRGADSNVDARGELGRMTLMWAVERRNEKVVQLLIDKGADVNAKDDSIYYKTALMIAVDKGYEEIVRLLLDKGANVNATGGTRWKTALENAAEMYDRFLLMGNSEDCLKEEKIIRILMDAGADSDEAIIEAANKRNVRAVKFLTDVSPDSDKALVKAVEKGERVVRLLLDLGVDVNAKDKWGKTALIKAVQKADEKVVQLLIDKGADVNPKDQRDGTALMEAARGGHERIAQLLINSGADVNGAALEASVKPGNEKMVKLLVKAGADARSCSSKSLLCSALIMGEFGIVSLLLEAGAIVDEATLRQARWRGMFKEVEASYRAQ